MKLVWAEVSHYKRFETLSKMHLDSKVTAIVGPNEAGKSSFLAALNHWNHEEGLLRSGSSQETTRGTSCNDDDVAFDCTFLLEEEDREALAEIPEAKDVRWLSVKKRIQGGEFQYEVYPAIKRDDSLRKNVFKEIEFCQSSILPVDESTEELSIFLHGLSELLQPTPNERELETEEQLQSLQSLVDSIQEFRHDVDDFPQVSKETSTSISQITALSEQLISYERKEHPGQEAKDILFARRPKFLLFEKEERSLLSEYNLLLDDTEIPIALGNLFRLAELDIEDLLEAFRNQDSGKIATLSGRANKKLTDKFLLNWSQAQIGVQLSITPGSENNIQVNILVGNLDTQLEQIAERSDGLRQFVALYAFIHSENEDRSKILLVDEAELHLHYDAQADLVQMFAKQDLVKQVIYTTHSIGCLPEDLGTGIRLIEPLGENTGRSKVKNWFWENNRPGFSPLMFAMGAGHLAFLPVRYAILAEGIVDHLLLPSLIREAIQQSYLGFQVVPGLSEASLHNIQEFDHEASRTLYLTDSDHEQKKLTRKIKSAGIPESRIFSLPTLENEVSAIEDYLDTNLYVTAINNELSRSHGSKIKIRKDDLSSFNISKSVDEWCKKKKIKSPSKRAVASQVLELRHEHTLLNTTRKHLLVELYHAFKREFEKI